jgi:acyl-CoA thioester hydrolase
MPDEAPWTTTARRLMNAWQCDIMGHMNTRHIEALFDEAAGWLITRASGGRSDHDEGIGWADRRHLFEFLGEILASDAVEVRSTVDRLGTSSVTTRHELIDSVDQRVLATAEVVTVCFDLEARASRPIPEGVAARLREPLA